MTFRVGECLWWGGRAVAASAGVSQLPEAQQVPSVFLWVGNFLLENGIGFCSCSAEGCRNVLKKNNNEKIEGQLLKCALNWSNSSDCNEVMES